MSKKLILTSFIAVMLANPALAVTETSNFAEPLKANYKYLNAANQTNLGKSSGTVLAAAYYDILPGYYLPANTYEPALCPANKYCAGAKNKTSSNSVQGSPVACPSAYPLSDQGAASEMFCYSSSSCPQPGTGVTAYSGRVYSDGISTCAPSSCAAGWTKTAGLDIWTNKSLTSPSVYNYSNSPNSGLGSSVTEWWRVEDPSYGTITGSIAWLNGFGMSDLGVTKDEAPDMLPAGYENHKFDGTYYVLSNTYNGNGETMPCYCNIKGYNNGSSDLVVTESAYKYLGLKSSQNDCLSGCANAFTYDEAGVTPWRNALLAHTSNNGISTCSANQYTASFSCGDGTGTVASQSVAMAGELTLPAGTGCTRTGHEFVGWVYNGVTNNAGDTITWNTAGNRSYVASWSANAIVIKWYNVSDTGAQNGVLSKTIHYGDDIVTPVSPIVKTGQKFLGWRITK